MRKLYIFLIIFGIVLSILTISVFVLSQIEKNTYVAKLSLEATSGYPPKLTSIRNQGVTEETALISIMPTLNLRQLSISEPHTEMSGVISIDCGGTYQVTKEFNLMTSNPGDRMKQNFVFKGIPQDRICKIVAKVIECDTKQLRCEKNSVSLILKTSTI